MINHKRYQPYIRRCHPSDKSCSIRTAIQIAHFDGQCFVLVQRGTRNRVLIAARSKQALILLLTGPRTHALRRGGNWRKPKSRDFRGWARSVAALM